MTSLFVGIYGVYLLMVGAKGNASVLMKNLSDDTPGYIPWLFAIIGIAVLSENETTEKLVKPFLALLILNFFLRNYSTVSREIGKIYSGSAGK